MDENGGGAGESGYVSSLYGGGGGSFVFAVPEASTWAMMLTGFAGLAFAGLRLSRRAAAAG